MKKESDSDFRRVADLLVGSEEEFELEIRGGTGPFKVWGTGGLSADPSQSDERRFSVTAPKIEGFGALYIDDMTTGDIFSLSLCVGLQLSISPTGPMTMELGGQSKVFFATGGFPPYSWKTEKGTLSSNSARYVVYTPGSIAGEDYIEVCDSAGECVSAKINVLISGITITPATGVMLPGEEKTFFVIGTTGSCQWDVPLGGEIIEKGENYVIYKAPDIKGEYTLLTTDSLSGKSANITVRVIDNDLEVTPASANLNRNDNQSFSAVGGIPPYMWTVEQGNLDSTQGADVFYTAHELTGRYRITVRDAGGRKASAMIDVGGELRISPVLPVVNMGDEIDFSLSGGEGEVTFRVTDGDLSEKTETGVKWSSPIKSGTYYIIASDGRGRSVQAVVRVVSKNVTVSPEIAEVNQGETLVLTAAGGSAPYIWSAETGSLSSSQGKTVFWRAPFWAPEEKIHINVEDSAGEFAQVKVSVTTSSVLAADPENLSISKGGTGVVSVIGGTGIYSVTSDDPEIASASIISSTITITGKKQGSTTVIIRDTAFNIITVSVIVGGSLDLAAIPASLTISDGNTSFFTVSGGSEPYSVSVSDHSIITALLSGNRVIVKGVSQGTASITVTDTNGAEIKVEAEVKKMKKAIIVAGGGPFPGNVLWDTTSFLAGYAYKTMILQGYTRDTIHYLSHDKEIDLDGNDFFDDIDDTPSNINLKSAITEWAKDSEELLIYIVDHGGKGSFRMAETQSLEASELKFWLDDLQSVIPGKVIFVYDACMSGSFLPVLASSNNERILITSSSEDQNAYFTSNGILSFSYLFWGQIINGADIEYAFFITKNAVEYTYNAHQVPLIDDNGNGIGNDDEDGNLAETTIIGNGVQTGGALPVIESVSQPNSLDQETSATIYADNVTGSDGIKRVWAVITPPGYDPGDPETPVVTIPELEMSSVGNSRYEGTYTNFSLTGKYKVAVYARDNSGNISMPFQTSVEQTAGQNYATLYPSTMRISIPCLKFMDTCNKVNLNYYPIPSDPDSIFFTLDFDSFAMCEFCKDDCAEADSGLTLTIPKIEIMKSFYGVKLDYDPDLSNQNQVIWKVDPTSLVNAK